MRTVAAVVEEKREIIEHDLEKVENARNRYVPTANERRNVALQVKNQWGYTDTLYAGAKVNISLTQTFVYQHFLASREMTGLVVETSAKAFRFQGYAIVRYSDTCLRCGRDIINPISMLAGYGPICSDILGIPHDFSEDQIEAVKERAKRESYIDMWIPTRYARVYIIENGEVPENVEPAYAIQVILQSGRIHVKGDTWSFKDALKDIPGRMWSPAYKAWIFPDSPEAAKNIYNLFEHSLFKGKVYYDDDVMMMLESAEQIERAQELKSAESLPEIPNTRTAAWKHQKQAFWFAHGLRAAMLAMDMGTGKSKVTVDLIVNRGHKRTIIVCPKSVMPVWGKQFKFHAAWNDEDYSLITLGGIGSSEMKVARAKRAMNFSRQNDKPLVLVVNYDTARTPVFSEWILTEHFDLAVLDESHKVKAPAGVTSKFVEALGRIADYRLCLTGTPMPHSPLDVFGQYRFLDPGIFGLSFTKFRDEYAYTGGYSGKQVINFKNQDKLNKLFYSIGYRVTKDVLDLPPVLHVERTCELSGKTLRLYQQMSSDFYAKVESGEITAKNALVRLLRLAQIANGHVYDEDRNLVATDSAKVELFADVLDDFSEREPIVTFTRFIPDLDNIKAEVEKSGRTYAELSGRRNDLAAWQAGEFDVLGVQIQAGGVGIDLTRARYAIYYSVGFSLGDYEQSLARIHRPGQTENTTYIHLIAENTVDEKIYAALVARKSVIEFVLNLNA